MVPLLSPHDPGVDKAEIVGPFVAGTIIVCVVMQPPGIMGGPMSKLSSSAINNVYVPGASPVKVYVGSKVTQVPAIPVMLAWYGVLGPTPVSAIDPVVPLHVVPVTTTFAVESVATPITTWIVNVHPLTSLAVT